MGDKKGIEIFASEGSRSLLGMLVSALDPAITDILGAAEFDFVILDAEASPMDPATALHHVRAAEAANMVPLVRLQENSPGSIRSFLDIGCRGVVIPHIESALELEQAVAAARLQPHGLRGMCPCCHGASYSPPGSPSFQRWISQDANDVMVAPIIETKKALDDIENIAALDGVRGVLFGPGDLSQDLGIAHGDTVGEAVIMEAWRTVVSACHAKDKFVMAFPWPKPTLEVSQRFIDDGADAMVHYMDLLLFHEVVRGVKDTLRLERSPASI